MNFSRRELLVVYVLLGLLLVGSGVLVWQGLRARPASARSGQPSASGQALGQAGQPGQATGSATHPGQAPGQGETGRQPQKPPILVHVAGAVKSPGVYQLDRGARVVDAIYAAGGTAAEGRSDVMNLAAPVSDGERVYVPSAKEVEAGFSGTGSGPGGSGTGSPNWGSGGGGKVNVNRAGPDALDKLPGVGPAMAERIIQYRQTKGPFQKVDDLRNVPGIGERKFKDLEPYVTVN